MRVLIADDNKGMRGAIRWVLRQWPDLEVCAETANGREAVDAAYEQRPDLLILDVRMPELNGIEVASIVREGLPEARTILFTMYNDHIGRQLAAAAGVEVILPKVEGVAGFTKAIASILEARDK